MQAGLAHGSHPAPSPGPSCRLLSPGEGECVRPWPRGARSPPHLWVWQEEAGLPAPPRPSAADAFSCPASWQERVLLAAACWQSPQEGGAAGARHEKNSEAPRLVQVLEEGLLGLLSGRRHGCISGVRVSPSAPLSPRGRGGGRILPSCLGWASGAPEAGAEESRKKKASSAGAGRGRAGDRVLCSSPGAPGCP